MRTEHICLNLNYIRIKGKALRHKRTSPPVVLFLNVPGLSFLLSGRSSLFVHLITKIYLYNVYLFKPHFYTVKTGVYIGIYYFSYFCSKHRLWVLGKAVLMKNYLSVQFLFLVVKFSMYLNRRVFVISDFICGVCSVLLCSSSLLTLIPGKVYAS